MSAESQTLGTRTTTDAPTVTPSNSAPVPTILWLDPSNKPAAYHCTRDLILGLNCGIRKIVVDEDAFPHVVFT